MSSHSVNNDRVGQAASATNTFSNNMSIGNTLWGFEDHTNGFTGHAGTDSHYDGSSCNGNGVGDSSPPTICD